MIWSKARHSNYHQTRDSLYFLTPLRVASLQSRNLSETSYVIKVYWLLLIFLASRWHTVNLRCHILWYKPKPWNKNHLGTVLRHCPPAQWRVKPWQQGLMLCSGDPLCQDRVSQSQPRNKFPYEFSWYKEQRVVCVEHSYGHILNVFRPL
jgi:hypothetical protein